MDEARKAAPAPNQKPRRRLRLAFPLSLLVAAFLGYTIHVVVSWTSPPDYRSLKHGNKEVVRVNAPDGRLAAVVDCYCETPAMVSPYSYLHIVPAGHGDESSSPALIVSRRDLQVVWVDNAHLQVDPGRGTIEYFTNLWVPQDDRLPFVELTLNSDPANHLITPDGHFSQ